MEEKELFAYTVIPEKWTYFFMKFYIFCFLFIFMFFNNWPMNNIEFIVYDFLLKDIGFYSHYYTFQSILISNFIAFSVSVICVYIFSKSRVVYVTRSEAEELGFLIKYNFRFKVIRVIVFFVSLPVFLFMFVYMFFFDVIDLEESGRNTAFFRGIIFILFLFFLIYSF